MAHIGPLGRTGAGWREPMLATLTDRRFSDEGWIFERKLDGVRAICSRNGDTPQLWSRNRKALNDAFPEIVDALAAHGGDRFVADGEIVAFEGTRTSFSKLAPRIHLTDPVRARESGIQVFYYLFDLLHFDGSEAVSLPLRLRKQLLQDAFDYEDPLRFSSHHNTDGEQYFEYACENGWEGLIAKRAASAYRHGRSADWLKFKCVADQELVIVGYTDPQGAREGFGALLLGYYDDSGFRYAGKVGTGFDRKTLRELHAALVAREVFQSPFPGLTIDPGTHWVRPELVAQIGFAEWTTDGRLRHPRFVGLRTDKDPAQVRREQQRQ
jgi:bifunctional non-homologous end joining protein LigD